MRNYCLVVEHIDINVLPVNRRRPILLFEGTQEACLAQLNWHIQNQHNRELVVITTR